MARQDSDSLLELICCQFMESRLVKVGYSGSTSSLSALMSAYNRRFGTKFNKLEDVATFFNLNN